LSAFKEKTKSFKDAIKRDVKQVEINKVQNETFGINFSFQKGHLDAQRDGKMIENIKDNN